MLDKSPYKLILILIEHNGTVPGHKFDDEDQPLYSIKLN